MSVCVSKCMCVCVSLSLICVCLSLSCVYGSGAGGVCARVSLMCVFVSLFHVCICVCACMRAYEHVHVRPQLAMSKVHFASTACGRVLFKCSPVHTQNNNTKYPPHPPPPALITHTHTKSILSPLTSEDGARLPIYGWVTEKNGRTRNPLTLWTACSLYLCVYMYTGCGAHRQLGVQLGPRSSQMRGDTLCIVTNVSLHSVTLKR